MTLVTSGLTQTYLHVSGFNIDDGAIAQGLLTAYPQVTWVSGSNYSLVNLYNFNGFWTLTQLSGICQLLSGTVALMPTNLGDMEEYGGPIP